MATITAPQAYWNFTRWKTNVIASGRRAYYLNLGNKGSGIFDKLCSIIST